MRETITAKEYVEGKGNGGDYFLKTFRGLEKITGISAPMSGFNNFRTGSGLDQNEYAIFPETRLFQ